MNITILLLVSDPIVRFILKETLEHEGYTVVAAGDLGWRQTGSRVACRIR
jgi:CheY-like chemotaxis protein